MTKKSTFFIVFVLIVILVAIVTLNRKSDERVVVDYVDSETELSELAKGVSFDLAWGEIAIEKPATQYISVVDWPPRVWVDGEAYACGEAGVLETRAGESKTVTAGGYEWCRTLVAEGAAGSEYWQYSYTRPLEDKTQVINFTLRAVRCENYPEAEAAACATERAEFKADTIVANLVADFATNYKQVEMPFDWQGVVGGDEPEGEFSLMEWRNEAMDVEWLPALRYVNASTNRANYEAVAATLGKIMRPSNNNMADSPLGGQMGFESDTERCLISFSFLDVERPADAPIEVTSDRISLAVACSSGVVGDVVE